MKHILSVFAIAALAIVVPAHAGAIYSVDFTGAVSQTQGANGEAIGDSVSGHFDLDSGTGDFLDFTIAGQSVATGYESFASIGPALTDAIFTAQLSPVSSGSPSNSSFTLDLSALSNWPSTDTALTLLADGLQLTTNLDMITNPLSAFPSTFGYYTADANGSNVVSLNANLTSISAVASPEPASLVLLVSSFAGLGLVVRRNRV